MIKICSYNISIQLVTLPSHYFALSYHIAPTNITLIEVITFSVIRLMNAVAFTTKVAIHGYNTFLVVCGE